MANGQVSTIPDTKYGSFFWVKWESVAFPYALGTVGIKWECGVDCGCNLYNNAIRMSAVTINKIKVYEGGTYSNFMKGSHTIASGSLLINEDDGVTIGEFSGWLYKNNNYESDGAHFSLGDTADGAIITSAPDFTDVEDPVIVYTNPSGNAKQLQACISLTGEDDIIVHDIVETGVSYQFKLTDEERKLLRESVTTDPPKKDIIFRIRSVAGGKIFKSEVKKTFTVTENEDTKPAVAIASLAPVNGSLHELFDGLYIQGKSAASVTVEAAGKYGAEIESYYAVAEGKTYNGQTLLTDFLQSSGAVEIEAFARDSRGFTGSAKKTINVLEYAKPMVIPLSRENAIQCYRSDDNGKRVGNSKLVWVKAKMSYHSVNGKNDCALQYRARPLSEAWNNDDQGWGFLLDANSGTDEYNALVPRTFDLTESYTFQIRAVDAVGEYDIKTFEIPTQDVALHLGKDGKNVTIGDYCDYSEPETFRSAWKAIFDGGVQIGDKTLEEYIKSVINGG